MRYSYNKGVEKQRSRKWVIVPVLALFVCAYVVLNTLAPTLPTSFISADATAKRLVTERPTNESNRLYLPKINIDLEVASADSADLGLLEKAAVNRSSTSGNPKEGGNFVLAAQRFSMGLTPMETREKSPFYNLHKFTQGDDIFVDYDGVRYAYKVIEIKNVGSDDTEIEKRTDDKRLTLYTSEAASARAGRDVVIAKLEGTIVWDGDVPKLKAL